MWIWFLLIPMVVIWTGVALAACQVSGHISQEEDRDAYVDATVAELLEGIEIEPLPAPR